MDAGTIKRSLEAGGLRCTPQRFAVMAFLGLGNGAIFQIVPQRFPKEIGVVTGLVGAAGGIGGFLLPTLLGALREWTNSYNGGFLLFAVAGILSALLLRARQAHFLRLQLGESCPD